MSAGVAAGVHMLGTIISGVGEAKGLRADARITERNANLALLEGEYDVAQTYREARQVKGVAQAALAGSGALTGTGTAADLIRESAFQAEMEVATTRRSARYEADSMKQEAANLRHRAGSVLIGTAFSALSQGVQYEMGRTDRATLRAQSKREFGASMPRSRGLAKPGAGGGGQFGVLQSYGNG